MAKRKMKVTVGPERLQRINKIKRMVLNGVTSKTEMAAALHVSSSTITQDVKWLYAYWKETDPEYLRERLVLRIKQYENLLHLSLTEFDKSKQASKATITVQRKALCSTCRGKGYTGKDEDECPVCEATGWIIEEQVTERIEGKTGDAGYINTARACLADICKLEGLVTPRDKSAVTINNVNMIHEQLSKNSDNPLMNISSDLLIKLAKEMNQPQVIEGKVED